MSDQETIKRLERENKALQADLLDYQARQGRMARQLRKLVKSGSLTPEQTQETLSEMRLTGAETHQ